MILSELIVHSEWVTNIDISMVHWSCVWQLKLISISELLKKKFWSKVIKNEFLLKLVKTQVLLGFIYIENH